MQNQRDQLKKDLDLLKQEAVESRAEVRSKLDQRDLSDASKGKLVFHQIYNHKKKPTKIFLFKKEFSDKAKDFMNKAENKITNVLSMYLFKKKGT